MIDYSYISELDNGYVLRNHKDAISIMSHCVVVLKLMTF